MPKWIRITEIDGQQHVVLTERIQGISYGPWVKGTKYAALFVTPLDEEDRYYVDEATVERVIEALGDVLDLRGPKTLASETAAEAEDLLSELWASVAALYSAFDLSPTEHDTRRFFLEESREFLTATDGYPEDEIDEAGDVLFTLVGVMMAKKYDSNVLHDAIRGVITKNGAKRPGNGWAVVDGKIRKVAGS